MGDMRSKEAKKEVDYEKKKITNAQKKLFFLF